MSARGPLAMPKRPAFFATPAAWRAWLERHHADTAELWVGFHRKATGRPSITWPESVDGALCFGWIDGLRRSLDATRYVIRFTPRKSRSGWSNVNVKRYRELLEEGLVHAAGEAAFARREEVRTGGASYEQANVAFSPAQTRAFRTAPKAWAFFSAQAPWYRRTATWWVISAKQETTRARRLATLIADSAAGRTIAPLTRKARP